MSVTIKRFISENRIFFISVLVFTVAAIVYPNYTSEDNIFGLFLQMPAYGFAALGLTWCFIGNELDVSMGSIMALVAVMFAMVASTYGFVLGLITALVVAIIAGSITGFFVSFLKLDSFIVSLCMLLAARGTALVISHEMPVLCMEPVTKYLFDTKFLYLPILFWIFVIFVVLNEIVLKYTKFGRGVYVVGGAKDVAIFAGVNVRFYKFIIFVMTAVFSALGAIVMVCRQQSGSPILAEDGPLAIIPMVIVGGTAMSGGKGGAVKTLFGVIFMNMVFNIMALMGVYVNIQSFVKGAILLSVVIFDNYMTNRNKKV